MATRYLGEDKKIKEYQYMMKEDMQFIGIKDFYIKSNFIRAEYKVLPLDKKWEYKYYVYSRPFLKDFFKDIIWQYLNESEESIFYISEIDLWGFSRKSKL